MTESGQVDLEKEKKYIPRAQKVRDPKAVSTCFQCLDMADMV
jgi:hypothetical protein